MHIGNEQLHHFYTLLICSLLFAECIGIPTTGGSSVGTFIHLTDRRVGAITKSSVKKSNASTTPTTSICLLSKESGTCNDKVQHFYFNAIIGVCVGFIYTGCDGNENRFKTREECEQRCMSGLKSSSCANGYSISHVPTNLDERLNCSNRRCDDGFICVTDERSISQCCNQTIEQSYAAARSSFCIHDQRSLRSVMIHLEVLFARDCDDLLCTNGFECIQINTLFAKCCQRDHIGQMPSAKPPLIIAKEKRVRSNPISREQIKRQSSWIGNKNFKSPCAMPKHEGNCSGDYDRMAQFFFYDPDWQSCFAFKYTGCGGNANRFITIDDCESKCLYADGSVCKGPLPSVEPTTQNPPCADDLCPVGYTCSYGFGYMECCNSTIQHYVNEAYSSTCPDGSLAGGINEDYFMATFAKNCSDLLCDAPQRCIQVSPYFAKCCGLAPIPPQPYIPPTIENGHRSHGSPLDASPGTLDENGIESNTGMLDSNAGTSRLPLLTPKNDIRSKGLKRISEHIFERPTENKRRSICEKQRDSALINGRFYVPQCTIDGCFHRLQCDRLNGSCWCVNATTGTLISDHISGPADPLPTCGAVDVFTCKRIPLKKRCNNGTPTQTVLRWYSNDLVCRLYPYSYCIEESRQLPHAIKRKKDCERLCINIQMNATMNERF